MNNTPELREWVNEQVDKYYKQIGVNRYPSVYYSVDDMPKHFHCNCHVKEFKKYAGLCFVGKDNKHPHSILLNIKYHKTYKDLENTIAEEMMHIRFPNLDHNNPDSSRVFYTRLGEILQGKHFPKAVRKPKK